MSFSCIYIYISCILFIFFIYMYILYFVFFIYMYISCILSFPIYTHISCILSFSYIYIFFLLQRPSLSVRYARAISFPRPRISPQYVASRPYTSHGRDTDTSDMSLSRDIFISRRTSLLAPCPTCLAPPRVPLMPHPPPARPPACASVNRHSLLVTPCHTS